VSVFDGRAVITQSAATLPRLAQIRTIGTEKLTEPVLRGKRIFYNAADTRMSREGYLSCASCHLDGDSDGQVWDFTDRGEGLRNTTSLRGQGGHATAPFHWTGNFDEVQDFENDVRNSFGGTGFMSDADYFAGTRRLPLGDPKAGLSQDLDDLAAYLDSLVETGRSPRRDGLGALTAAAEAGKLLFESLGCRTCHGSERFNDPNPGSRHDVGTIKTSSGQRLGAPLDGLDTPTLAGLWATAPYLHDGSANTVKDVLTTANPDGRHADASALSPDQLDQLVDYLMQIEYGP
jgi:cytochrome c peroxidase